MTLAQSIYQHSLNLPEAAAREVLDFVRFIEYRQGAGAVVDDAAPRSDEARRAAALARLAKLNLHFNGKPISERDELYDDSRG